ncbi:formate dehydrogenase accessory sulfurtransferase FdhD [Roseateles sp.]|uniref:formate dehydrogenase accessory sulfurtransferase FdhD n=1 Tax=Roseateles sp. TaxID=1971397 RepID=UPI0026008B80|nr:formate dehydrogenase accessory sulfurtransferase FdhD [Roseateles sp.]MBV8036860.1 formate dehydrogenase accessory sulfurtransferase FdhD [Roseateles sp.]
MPLLDAEATLLPDALLTLCPPSAAGEERVAVETPVALTVNGVSQAVMLATPADLEDFALGFALSEGWITSRRELLDVDVVTRPDGVELALHVTAAREQHLKARRRLLAGRTGCGLCGLESLAQVGAVQPAPVRAPLLAEGALDLALAGLHAAQVLNARCGGLHGAAWCLPSGELRLAREDIGRHNALDKLAGALARHEADPRDGFVLMSSRASYELVHKTAMAGAGLLACMSAPSSLAIETASRLGLQLWAFVREGRATRYA